MPAATRARRARAPRFIDPPGYVRHRPQGALLYWLVEQHYPAFRELRARMGRRLPDYVEQEFDAYLKCGRLEEGFLTLHEHRRTARLTSWCGCLRKNRTTQCRDRKNGGAPDECTAHVETPCIDTTEDIDLREALIAVYKGTYRQPIATNFRTPLNRLPLDGEGNYTRRLSRIAMTQGGEVDMKFYAFTPAGGIHNQPIEFDLQLHREPRVDANRKGDKSPVLADAFTCVKPAGTGKVRMPDELEKIPAGVKKESGTRQMQAWLGRLVGQYTVEGYVDLCGNGNPEDQQPATGKVDCIAAGSPPSVHCKVNVSWPLATGESGALLPGGVSNLAPAQFLFSLFTVERRIGNPFPVGGVDKRGLNFVRMDSREIAEGAWGELVGDAFMSREDCVDIPGDCHKITRITARPDSNEISMRVDVEMDGKRVLRQSFVLRRESNLPDGKQTTGSSP